MEYAPTPSAHFRLLLRDLPRDVSEYTFVDFGSGNGRVLILAAQQSFKATLGVEFSPELHRMATENLAHA